MTHPAPYGDATKSPRIVPAGPFLENLITTEVIRLFSELSPESQGKLLVKLCVMKAAVEPCPPTEPAGRARAL